MLVRSVRTSHAYNFVRICGNENQPGPQLVKKLATPLDIFFILVSGEAIKCLRCLMYHPPPPTPSLSQH